MVAPLGLVVGPDVHVIEPHPFRFIQPCLIDAQTHQLQEMPQPSDGWSFPCEAMPVSEASEIDPSVDVSNSAHPFRTADLAGAGEDAHLSGQISPRFALLSPHERPPCF